jgi:chromosomal replication initiator protein
MALVKHDDAKVIKFDDVSQDARHLWDQTFDYLKQFHAPIVRTWFAELTPLKLTAGVLTIACQTIVQKRHLIHHCKDVFTQSVQAVSGRLITLDFICEEPESVGAHRRLSEETVLSPDFTFDNFIVGPTNELAYSTCQAVAREPGKLYNPLFIHGAPGLGKTHLLQATCQALLKSVPDARIEYVSCDNFINLYVSAINNGSTMDFRNRFRQRTDILIVDDVHFLAKVEITQEEFFHTFNALFQSGRQIILSSDSMPGEIPMLEQRLVSRFVHGMIAPIGRPCFETRCGIVRHKARLRGIIMPEDVITTIARRYEDNVRELEGAISKIHGCAMLNGGKYDMETAIMALGDATPASERIVSLQQIVNQVSAVYGVRIPDLQGKSRSRSIALPRQIAMHLARKKTHHSLSEIGGFFGGRDHTTVLHAIKTIENACRNTPALRHRLEELESEIDKEALRSTGFLGSGSRRQFGA